MLGHRAPALVAALAFFVPLITAGIGRSAATAAGAVAVAGYGSALPRFALFGWVSPPRDSTTPERYGEMAGAGFNVTMLAWDDSGRVADNLVRLEVSRPFGLKNLLLDNDLDNVATVMPASLALADSIVARYRDHPAFLGYYLGDEPLASQFPRLGDWFEILRTRDPAHPAWNSLAPRGAFDTREEFQAYVEAYAAATHPAVLCNNQYDFQITGDRHRLTENVSTLAAVARANGIPFWGIVLLVEHWKFRPVTEGMLRWQIAEWLAWGATGIGYFTYWTPPSVPEYEWGLAMIEWNSGRRTPYYQLVSALNARLLTLGEFMAGLRWQSTQHAGSQPVGGVPFAPDSVLLGVDGRATVGRFADARGARYAFVANADSLAQRTITLALAPGWSGIGLRDDGSAWDPLAIGPDGRLWLTLAAGDFVLVRLVAPGQTVAVGSPATRAAPSLRVAPNPARGVVRFTIEGATGPARLDVLDLAGRRLWSRSLASGTREATWSGEGAGGSGVYFARLSDARGAVVRRVAWLGTRTAAP